MFRKAEKTDIDAVENIYREIHKAEKDGITKTGWLDGIYPVRATALAGLARGDLYVYEENGKILACAVINRIQVDVYEKCEWKYPARDDEVMVLHTLAVLPSAAGKGIGTAFAGFYESYAAENGCKALRMDTNEINTPARSLYRKLGFREAGKVPCVFNGIPGVNLIMLEKRIGNN